MLSEQNPFNHTFFLALFRTQFNFVIKKEVYMFAIHPEYVTDEKLNKKAVIVPFVEWTKILEILEEFEDIQAYDAAKKNSEQILSFDDALKEIQKSNFDEI
jgi:hypothetical protein